MQKPFSPKKVCLCFKGISTPNLGLTQTWDPDIKSQALLTEPARQPKSVPFLTVNNHFMTKDSRIPIISYNTHWY